MKPDIKGIIDRSVLRFLRKEVEAEKPNVKKAEANWNLPP